MEEHAGGRSTETRTKLPTTTTTTRIRKTPFYNFEYAISSEQTRDYYHRKLKVFLTFMEIPPEPLDTGVNILFEQINKEGNEWFTDCLVEYLSFLKKKVAAREITAGTLRNYYKPIKLFCDMNNVILNWKMISRGIPSGRRAAQDRSPTIDEIHKLLEFPSDERIKPLVLVMVSSGIRLGAWDYLKWKHVIPILNNKGQETIAAKLIVYAGEPEQYFTFITPEAYIALKTWMEFRASFGEKITGESWLMRDKWQTTHQSYMGRYGMAAVPRKITTAGIRNLIQHIYFKQSIRTPLPKGEKHHEFKTIHGFRKFYKTVCEQVMKPANIELLIGHQIGISSSYYKPTESQLLEDYLKVVNDLTISEEYRLKKQLTYYKEREDKISEIAARLESIEKKWKI